MRDHVVQLARDARPLGLDGGGLRLAALELEPAGAGGQLVDAVAAAAQRLAEGPRPGVDDEHEHGLAASWPSASTASASAATIIAGATQARRSGSS